MSALGGMVIAIVDDQLHADTSTGRVMREIVARLEGRGLVVVGLPSVADALTSVVALPAVHAAVIDWDSAEPSGRGATAELIALVRARNDRVPLFLSADPAVLNALPLEVIAEVDEYVWVLQDTPDFITGRIEAAAQRYQQRLLPPMFGALVNFATDHEYSWHTPGHAGGTAFEKSPAGRLFHRFFGEQLLRSDLSISVGELGSLLDHSGPIGEAERFAAKVFGADMTFFVTNGTSSANKIVYLGAVSTDDIVLVDRNCHKSSEHAMTMTHSLPLYMMPTRNHYGIIGPIPPGEMTPDAVRAKVTASPLIADKRARPVHAVVTNSTYDGLCYDAVYVEEALGANVDRIHFDEAWYAYARFNPLYRNRFAMRDEARKPGAPTVFATQSTHKLLAALSQASMVHVRNGRAAIDHTRFNESFMMQSSTSPLYTIIASLDVAAKMMEGPMGLSLTNECIAEAVDFRQMMARITREIESGDGKDWWFGTWQPDAVRDARTGVRTPFADMTKEWLCSDPDCWVLHPGESWHGFEGLPDGYCMLDPIKVTVVTPGVNEDGSLAEWGIPAPIVVKYLDTQGTINEKSGDYIILFLFSMGVTQGKWGTLVNQFFEFKRLFDRNAPLEDVFPDLTTNYAARYGGMTLCDLAREMHEFKRSSRQTIVQSEAFARLPEPAMSYADAYRQLVRGTVEQVPVTAMAGRTVATGVVPYPPGIPLLMPGEKAGAADEPFLQYLVSLHEFDLRFPGFEHDIHGVEFADGKHLVYCIKES